jgi:hypothetical protein
VFDDLTGGFDLEADSNAPLGPALISCWTAGPAEILVLEEMHRKGAAAFPGSTKVMFTAQDDTTGEETWPAPMPPDFVDIGLVWQRLMDWPVVPIPDVAQAFVLSARLGLLAAWWDRLAAARAEDEAVRPATHTKQSG